MTTMTTISMTSIHPVRGGCPVLSTSVGDRGPLSSFTEGNARWGVIFLPPALDPDCSPELSPRVFAIACAHAGSGISMDGGGVFDAPTVEPLTAERLVEVREMFGLFDQSDSGASFWCLLIDGCVCISCAGRCLEEGCWGWLIDCK